MEGLRRVRHADGPPTEPCGRCGAVGCPWDRVARAPMCPDCQEALAVGEGPALRLRIDKRPCAVCRHLGTVQYVTYPLRSAEPIEIDLCGGHFDALLGRRLDRVAFGRLARLLRAEGVKVEQIFLLHEAFYDPHGRSLQPVPEAW